MKELKQHQLPMTIDEQVENLKNIGLVIKDEKNMTVGGFFHRPSFFV